VVVVLASVSPTVVVMSVVTVVVLVESSPVDVIPVVVVVVGSVEVWVAEAVKPLVAESSPEHALAQLL